MQILLYGLLQGLLIGAIGVAFSLVYRTTKVFHLSLGGLVALPPYVLLACLQAGLPVWSGVAIAISTAICLGILTEVLVHWPLQSDKAPAEVHLIASLGIYLVIVQSTALIWGNETQALRVGIASTWSAYGVTIAHSQLLGAIVSVTGVIALFFWLRRARRGLEMKALADNPTLVALLGRDVQSLRRWSFGVSAGLASLVGISTAWDIGFDPYLGLEVILLGMVAMIIGGSGSLMAPFVGGILLGVLRAQVVWFSSARWEQAITFVLLGLFLFFLPQGLFARKVRIEESR
jgi:branched-chain amino acid transport system permease protein